MKLAGTLLRLLPGRPSAAPSRQRIFRRRGMEMEKCIWIGGREGDCIGT